MDPRQKRILFILLGVAAAVAVLIIAIGIFIVLFTCTCEKVVHTNKFCPDGWVGYHKVCYYISHDVNSWEYSENFCKSHNGTLVIHMQEDTKDFLNRFKCSTRYWFGLKRNGQTWNWVDGANVRDNVTGDEGDCGVLDDPDELLISSADCDDTYYWICFKSAFS